MAGFGVDVGIGFCVGVGTDCVGVGNRVGAVVGVIADEVSAFSRSITAKAPVSPIKERRTSIVTRAIPNWTVPDFSR